MEKTKIPENLRSLHKTKVRNGLENVRSWLWEIRRILNFYDIDKRKNMENVLSKIIEFIEVLNPKDDKQILSIPVIHK